MKVILYMAMTVNGYIAKKDDDTSWISPTEWSSYAAAVKKVGCMVIGHRTYDIITAQPEFSEIEHIKIVVLAHSAVALRNPAHSAAASPREALQKLDSFDEIIVAGGAITNAAFLSQGLVDEMFVDIEPKLLGSGLPLLSETSFAADLQLLGSRMISENEIQLHYKILK